MSFFRYLRCEGTLNPDGSYPSIDSFLAFVMGTDARVHVIELGPAAELEKLAARWRESLGKPVDGSRGVGIVGLDGGSEEGTEREAGRALRAALLDPCLAVFGEEPPSALHVVLDDLAYLVPLDALPWDDGSRVGESLRIYAMNSTLKFVRAPRPLSGASRLVALGDADYDAKEVEGMPSLAETAAPPAVARSGSGPSFGRLVEAGKEAEAVAVLHAALDEGEQALLLGAGATKAAFLKHAPSARYLHVATHGWFTPESLAVSMRRRPGHRERRVTDLARPRAGDDHGLPAGNALRASVCRRERSRPGHWSRAGHPDRGGAWNLGPLGL